MNTNTFITCLIYSWGVLSTLFLEASFLVCFFFPQDSDAEAHSKMFLPVKNDTKTAHENNLSVELHKICDWSDTHIDFPKTHFGNLIN